MGIVTLTVGHLTLFSVMFISIVIGIGTDYGIYYLFRYEEEISLGRSLQGGLGADGGSARDPDAHRCADRRGATFFVLTSRPSAASRSLASSRGSRSCSRGWA